MWILKVFWAEMIIFPAILIYFILDIQERSLLQTGLLGLYGVVIVMAIGGYIHTQRKKAKSVISKD
ncbi:MAG: hypothetical protein HOB40_09215 [Candidatus Marinimicrobia bacterium]|jgi:hypothetical protein|nr:hypothetical protein [Candidatus Neomarinimicrobiota bacterium]MBT3839793.1 hypothetical protein [Candidatus Neomarinimicrobiota bacterium]MBT3999558.1 hypothetical protein [Candidatus Neomarinimicrobiota bacterium]MBT4283387.1 hypothetical protein [Candidatus Neomarinimicrobiota bacterium]MBT4578922.1 hypothetical protein [Candidatus Neomarinimicrobiota bacterium]